MTAIAPLWGPARTYSLMSAQPRRSMGQISDTISNVIEAAAPAADKALLEALFAPLHDLEIKIDNERALDAGDFRDYIAAGTQRLSLVDAQGKAERALAQEQKTWETTHRNADALAAAQAQVDSLQAQLADVGAKVDDLRARVDQHAQRINYLRDLALQYIASMPAEHQAEGRKVIFPCGPAPAMKGAGSRPVVVRSENLFLGGIRPVEVRIAGAPRGYAPPQRGNLMGPGNKLGQLVSVNPNVQVTVQTGFEKYLFPVGLMTAGGASFIVGTVIPPSFKVVTTIAGLGLIGWGVYSLIKGGTSSGAAAPGGAPAATPPPPTGATPIETSPQPFLPPSVPAFNQIQIEMISPGPDGNVSSVGTFLGIGSKKIPIQLSLFNPSQESVTFNLGFEWDEQGSSFGYSLSPMHGSKEYQITLGPGEAKNQEFDLPVQTTGSTNQMNVGLGLFKKRVANENKFLIMTRTFTVN